MKVSCLIDKIKRLKGGRIKTRKTVEMLEIGSEWRETYTNRGNRKMKMIRKLLDLKVNDDFTLECEMENGEMYLYDMSSIKNANGEMVEPLKDINYFKKVVIDYGRPTWPNGHDVDPAYIAMKGKKIKKSA